MDSKNKTVLFIEAMLRDLKTSILIERVDIHCAPLSVSVGRTIICLDHSAPLLYIWHMTIFIMPNRLQNFHWHLRTKNHLSRLIQLRIILHHHHFVLLLW